MQLLFARPADDSLRWSEISLPVASGTHVLLRRLLGQPKRAHRAVLLVPGANSSSNTFTMPHGGLVTELASRGCDVWMMDWRASPLVLPSILAGRPLGGSVPAERAAFTLDRMVAEDIPAALRFIRSEIPDRPLTLHGHCVGGGGLAVAVATGVLDAFDVDRVILSTLGLFYEVSWKTWVKAEDFLLESILLPNQDPDCRVIDPQPGAAWPKIFAEAYANWPRPWLPAGRSQSDEFLRRLSFMVGQPYSRALVDPSIDGKPIESIFGPLHLGLYLHLGQMVRRGYAAAFDVRDQIDRTRLHRGLAARPAPRGRFALRQFRNHHVTLISAGDNGVWHRDSIDLMYEWLRRDPKIRCEKHVFPGYNIQELYWGRNANTKVHPTLAEAVGLPKRSVTSVSVG